MTRRQFVLLPALVGCAVVAPLALAQRAPVRAAATTSATGVAIYRKWCSDCHSTATGPGSVALQRKYRGTPPAILLQRKDLSTELIEAAVRHGVSFMPSFRKTEITNAELAALAGYLAPTKPPATKRQ